MSTTGTLTISSIKMFMRNRQALFFSLFTPLIIMAVFGFIGFNQAQKITVGVVTGNPTAETSNFIDSLKNVPAFDIKTGTVEEEAKSLDNGDRALVVALPDNIFPKVVATAQPPTQEINVYINAGQAQQAQTALTILNQILDKTTFAITRTPPLFNVVAHDVNARNLKYIDFLLPGIVALAIMQMAVFSVAFVFADYKEKGVLKRLLATPMRPFQFVTANVITRLLVALSQALILILVGVIAFKAHIIGSYLLIFLIALLGGIMFLGLGFTISGFANTVESVPAIANLVVLPMLFLGGTFFPISAMPNWLQHIAKYLPLTYFSDALRQVMTQGTGLSGLRHDLFWMLGWAVVLIFLANYTFSFEGKKI
jgi:ABC-2 type transport system permease protein